MRFIYIFLLLVFTGCDKPDVSGITDKYDELKETISSYDADYIKSVYSDLVTGLKSKDYDLISKSVEGLDSYMETRSWKWFSEIYKLTKEGTPEAVDAGLSQLRQLDDLSLSEEKIISIMEKAIESGADLGSTDVIEKISRETLSSRFGEEAVEVIITVVMLAITVCRHGC